MSVVKNFEKVRLSIKGLKQLKRSHSSRSSHSQTHSRPIPQVQAAKVTATARFKEDLDLDSLDAVEVVMAVEEEFGIEIPDSEADKILSIADAVAYVSGHPMAK